MNTLLTTLRGQAPLDTLNTLVNYLYPWIPLNPGVGVFGGRSKGWMVGTQGFTPAEP